LSRTFKEAARFRDLLWFLITLGVYQSGVSTVVVLAAIYAQEVMGFDTQSLIVLIMVVNVTAAVGAFICGHLQDRMGSVHAGNYSVDLDCCGIGGLICRQAHTYVGSRKYYWPSDGGKPGCREGFGQ